MQGMQKSVLHQLDAQICDFFVVVAIAIVLL